MARVRNGDGPEKPVDPKKLARREAKDAKRIQRALQSARIRERREGGRGTLLTEPILVFLGRHHGDFRVFDQDGKQVGLVEHSRDRTTKVDRYELRSTDGLLVAGIEDRAARRLLAGAGYAIFGADGTEIATLTGAT